MALRNYGATIRTPSSRGDVSSSDPQQQALLDALRNNGVQDNQSDPSSQTRQLPDYQTSGPSRTTMPVPPMQAPSAPAPSVGGGISSTGAAASGAAPSSPNLPTSMGQYGGQMAGFDAGKLNDPNKHDPKYDFARVMSNFDPRQGLTPDMLSQLSALGYGNVSGSGDKMHIDNPSAAFNGASDFDVVQGLNGGNGQWAWQPQGGDMGSSMGAASAGPQMDTSSEITKLQSAAGQGDSYSALVLKYLMQSLGLDQAMMQNS